MTLYIGLASYNLASTVISDLGADLSNSNFRHDVELLDSYFQAVNSNLTRVIRLPVIHELAETSGGVASAETISALNRSILEIKYLAASENRVMFNFINLYFKNGISYQSAQQPLPYDDYESVRGYFIDLGYMADQKYMPQLWCDVVRVQGAGRNENLIIHIRKLYDVISNEVGFLVAGVYETSLPGAMGSANMDAMLINSQGLVLSAQDKSLIGLPLADSELLGLISNSGRDIRSAVYGNGGNRSFVLYKRTMANDLVYVLKSDYFHSVSGERIRDFAVSCLVVASIGIVFSIIAAVLLSRRLSAAAVSLQGVVKRLYEGDFSARFHFRGNDEITYIGEKFNDMLEHMEGLLTIQDRDSKLKRNLEIRLMQSQINPHLLYNTLDSVIWSLKNNDLERSQEIITSLSAFFKISLSQGSSLIPLRSELQLIENYIRIQKVARDKDIELRIDAPDHLSAYMIVKLSLQPMVENAILHGFPYFRDDGVISIRASLSGGCLDLTVEDNGIGLSPEECAAINESLSTYPPMPNQRHFGLYNVNRRIKNLFGDEYGVAIDSMLGDFTRVRMTLPPVEPDSGTALNEV